ncbi:MAG: TetR/AcrR family transcriptional regulator [Pseudomonadota bacterium]
MTNALRLPARDALIEAAFEVLGRDPSASLALVAEKAGVGRATLHRHFPTRDALMHALAKTAIAETDAACEEACENVQSAAQALELSLRALIPLGPRYGFLTREPVEYDPEISAEYDRQGEELRQLIEEAKREGALDTRCPTAWLLEAYDHLIFAGWEITRSGEATPKQAADLAWRTFTTGVGGQTP